MLALPALIHAGRRAQGSTLVCNMRSNKQRHEIGLVRARPSSRVGWALAPAAGQAMHCCLSASRGSLLAKPLAQKPARYIRTQ